MSRLYDHTTGKWMDVPDNEVDRLVLEGKHTFESGIDIPVVGPSGDLMTIKSDEAHDAFKEGFRWPTQADRDADFDKKNYQIRQENFDNNALAFTLGAARGASMGASDIALDTLGLGDAAKAVKEVNPIASGIGSAAGAVGSTFAGAGLLGTAAKGGAKALQLGEAGAEAITAGLGAGKAAKAIQTVAKATMGSAAEGAYWGLGEGVSEAALGDPHDVVNNLASGLTLGALMGGGFGAALGGGKVAAPYLKNAFEAGSGALQRGVKAGLGIAEKKSVVAALSAQGQEKLAKEYADLAGTPVYDDIRSMIMSGEYTAAKEQANAARASVKLFEKEQKDLRKGLNSYFETASKAEGEALNEGLQKAGGDAWKAADDIYKGIQQQTNDFNQAVVQFTDEANPVRLQQHRETIGSVVKRLDNIGTPEAKMWAERLDPLADADSLGRGAYSGKAFVDGTTEAAEATALSELKRNVLHYPTINDIADSRTKKALLDAWSYTKQVLTGVEKNGVKSELPHLVRPEVQSFNKVLDDNYTAYWALRKALGGKVQKASAIAKLAADPEKLDAIGPLMSNFGDFAPMLSKLKDAANNASARETVLQQIRSKISEMKQSSVNGALSTDDLHKIISESGFLVGDPMKRVTRMQEIGKLLKQSSQGSPLDQAIFLERMLKGGPSTLEKYLPFEKQLETLDAVSNIKGTGKGWGDSTALAAAGYLGGPVAGTVVAGLKAVQMVRGASPINIMRGISKVERATNAGVQRTQKVMSGAVDALTSSKFQRVVGATVPARMSKEDFKKHADVVEQMLNPEHMMEAMADMPGSKIPAVHAALSQKAAMAANYLHANIPKDPFIATSIFPNQTLWQPSEMELGIYQRRVQTVNDPMTAVESITRGTVTPEQIDALKNVWPEVYQNLQESIISGMMEAKAPVSYQSKLIVAQVFGVPADYSLTPEFINSMQSQFAPKDEGGRPQGSPDATPRSRPQKSIDIKPMQSMATDAQNITFRTDIK